MSGNIEQENADRLKGLQGGGQQQGAHPAPIFLRTGGFQPRNGLGIAALVLGIIGMIPFPITGFWCSLLAIIFGAIGRNRARSGIATNKVMATWGLWLGIVGMCIQALAGLAFALS